MYYYVTVATDVGSRQLTYINARSRDGAKRRVAEYNARHPDWNMRLLKRRATRKPVEVRLFRRK